MAVSRFAPSPNGSLHLGHAYSAIVAHDLAKHRDGTFLLRIEDIDGPRSRPELAEQFRADLGWLGPAIRGSRSAIDPACEIRRGGEISEGGRPALSLHLHACRYSPADDAQRTGRIDVSRNMQGTSCRSGAGGGLKAGCGRGDVAHRTVVVGGRGFGRRSGPARIVRGCRACEEGCTGQLSSCGDPRRCRGRCDIGDTRSRPVPCHAYPSHVAGIARPARCRSGITIAFCWTKLARSWRRDAIHPRLPTGVSWGRVGWRWRTTFVPVAFPLVFRSRNPR